MVNGKYFCPFSINLFSMELACRGDHEYIQYHTLKNVSGILVVLSLNTLVKKFSVILRQSQR